jgi:hypothetical protein
MTKYSYSCISGIIILSILLFILSLLFLLFSIYYYTKYKKVNGILTGNIKSDCSNDLYDCVEVMIKDPNTGSIFPIYVRLDKNTTKNTTILKGTKVTLFYDTSITDLSTLDFTNTYIDNNGYFTFIFFIGFFLLLGSIFAYSISFPNNYLSYNVINCSKFYNQLQGNQ